MYYNGQHAFDHSCVYRVMEHSRNGSVFLDQYLVFTVSCFYKIGNKGLTKSSVGKFTANVTLDIVGKTYINETGFLFEDCNYPVGFYKNQKYSTNLVNGAPLNLGTSDSNIMKKLHEYCSKLAKDILDEKCKHSAREYFYINFNGIKLVDVDKLYPISPFAIEVMKKEHGNDAAILSTFNLLATQKREVDIATREALRIDPEKESRRAQFVTAGMQGGFNGFVGPSGRYNDPYPDRKEYRSGNLLIGPSV